VDEDFIKQFLPTGFSIDQHWLKLVVWLATPVTAWLVTKTGMPEDLAKWFVGGVFATGLVTILSIAHAQASRLKGAAAVVSAQQTPASPDVQVNTAPMTVNQQQRLIPTPVPQPVHEPAPAPVPQVVQLTPAQLQTLLSRAAAVGIAQHKAAAVAQQDTVAGAAHPTA
jgi:hypothetical protein